SLLMSTAAIISLSVIGVLSLICAALIHSLIAAFDHVPYVQEREIEVRTRGDGSPTSAARLAQNQGQFRNIAAVAYLTCEVVLYVCLSALVWQTTSYYSW